ncbi:kinase [Umboniibacter marinipuniceus]|uniref:D-glycerate 3-kinase n=1 Tax=Umboniibacter marinipuniceus TaxID=569599 RepID=A0A3M0AFG3_9GAMM|nr:kinase [Umboniibacter marinipuniceus]RMA81215.1 D-glycerate 3-kinase [Umboniibacter marinipuniceus]
MSNEQIAELVEDFATRYRLGPVFVRDALKFIVPLALHVIARRALKGRPIVMGINGCQGSGKSTTAALLAELLMECSTYSALAISIDDFYLSSEARVALSEEVHPLLITRGVPGTHDLALAMETLEQLTNSAETVAIPSFNKATDEPRPKVNWHQFGAPCDILILEGWCLGITPQLTDALALPINSLEAREDPKATWRTWVNERLVSYQALFARIDCLVMLKAPSFSCVASWRLEQEQRLSASLAEGEAGNRVMGSSEVERFVQHFQRLTEHALNNLADRADVVLTLDSSRKITGSVVKMGGQ